MFGNLFSTGVKQQPNAAVAADADVDADENDEEIAFQLQLDAIEESFHPKSQPSSFFQDGASSSGCRADPYSRTLGRHSGSPGPDRPVSASERMRWFSDQNPRQTAVRDGADDGTTSGSTRVGRDPMECVICTEMRPYTSFMSATGCTHEYCYFCCQRYAEEKVASGSAQIPCPHDGCGHDFNVHQCHELLSQASFEILSTRQAEAAIPSSLKVYCPFQDCSAFMENCSASNGDRGSRFVECWACHRGFCVECNIPWHANLTCSQYRADAENRNRSGDEKLRDLAKQEKWQSCPDCKRVIELKEGCYHMTCLCGNEFCYSCGAKWKNKVATCKCKLWDESNIIRRRRR